MGRFAIMPVIILENTEITDSEKLLLMLVSGLSEKNGFCYATNEYLASERKCSVRTVQRQLKKLEKLNLLRIDTQCEGYTRRIFVLLDNISESSCENSGLTHDANGTGGDTDVMGGDTDVMGGDIGVAETGVFSDKINNNKKNYKEKEIYKEKESQSDSEVFIKLPLKDGESFAVTESYVDELISQYPDKEVREELKLMRAWLLDKPEKERKTMRGINRFIYSWLKRAKEGLPLTDKAHIYPTAEETSESIKDFDREQEEGRRAYLEFKARRAARNGGM